MSTRVICLNFIPEDLLEWPWADAILHPGTTVQELWTCAHAQSWQQPLQVMLSPGDVPTVWLVLKEVWTTLFQFRTPEHYSVHEEERCQLHPKGDRSLAITHDDADSLRTFPWSERLRL